MRLHLCSVQRHPGLQQIDLTNTVWSGQGGGREEGEAPIGRCGDLAAHEA